MLKVTKVFKLKKYSNANIGVLLHHRQMTLVLPEGKEESNKRRIPAWPSGSSGWLSGRAGDPGSIPGPGENFFS